MSAMPRKPDQQDVAQLLGPSLTYKNFTLIIFVLSFEGLEHDAFSTFVNKEYTQNMYFK
jgi:hypothetical protein